MIERKEPVAPRTSAKKKTSVAALPQTRKKPLPVKPKKSVSFQIRTTPDTKALAEHLATDHDLAGRSKLDAEMYRRGVLLTMALLGPGEDGSYAGMSEQELARQLAPLFDRQYAILDRQQVLARYVYRVWPPGGVVSPGTPAPISRSTAHTVPEEQAAYVLGEEAQGTLDNFAEEI